jgi:hypothetical protein
MPLSAHCAPTHAPTPPLPSRRQAGDDMLKLVEKIRSLAKSATDLASRGVDDAAEFLHAKLWDGTPASVRSARACALLAPRALRSCGVMRAHAAARGMEGLRRLRRGTVLAAVAGDGRCAR